MRMLSEIVDDQNVTVIKGPLGAPDVMMFITNERRVWRSIHEEYFSNSPLRYIVFRKEKFLIDSGIKEVIEEVGHD